MSLPHLATAGYSESLDNGDGAEYVAYQRRCTAVCAAFARSGYRAPLITREAELIEAERDIAWLKASGLAPETDPSTAVNHG